MPPMTLTPDGDLPREVLEQSLRDLLVTKQKMLTNQQIQSSQYSSSGGGMATTRFIAQVDQIDREIASLRQRLGLGAQRRRAIGVRFG